MNFRAVLSLAFLMACFQVQLHADNFDVLRLRWRDLLTGGTNLDAVHPAIAQGLDTLNASAQTLWDTMAKDATRAYLWSDLPSAASNSAQITSSYERIKKMALAYATTGGRLAGDPALRTDLIGAMNFMWSKYYNASKSEYGNWWDWEIGAPLQINDITVLLYDDLSAAQLKSYMDAVNKFTPTPNKTAANRVWQATVVGVRGAIVKDPAKLALSRDALSQVFVFSTSGDGFYSDGSFIQHTDFAYNGGYGNSLLANIVPLMLLLNGSQWQVTDPNSQNVFRWIHQSYEPLVYKGGMMDMVRGREISRPGSPDHTIGASVVSSVLRASQFASASEAQALRSLVKYWIQSDTYRDYVANAPVPLIPQALEILDDPATPPRDEVVGHFHFARMDRVVHLRPGFGLALSMSSKRIANYESLNDENLHGWYTGDGMTYLYNADLGQFSDGFWPTVNPYHLPGTTVDTIARANASGEEYKQSFTWVGGATLGPWGVAGMQLDAYNSTLTAKKSWFMFEDEIVALGAGITCGDKRTIETIVENRKLNSAGDNLLTIDDVPQAIDLGTASSLTNIAWAHLQGSVPGADIGYYFPAGAVLKTLREARTNAWFDINKKTGTTNLLTRNYQTLWIDHGIKPTAATYSYVLLPGKSVDQVRDYAAAPAIQILENSAGAQAVLQTNLNVKAINFWNDATYTVAGVTVNKKSAVIVRQTPDELSIALADPTQAGSSVTVQVATPVLGVISLDPGVTVQALGPKLKLTFNVKNTKGATLRARFQLTPATAPAALAMAARPLLIEPYSQAWELSPEDATGSVAVSISDLGTDAPATTTMPTSQAQPRLTFQTTGNQTLILSWPSDCLGCRLQSSTNFPGANWTENPGSYTPPVEISITPSGPAVFYRLISQ